VKLKQNDCLRVLLDNGANPNSKSPSGLTPLLSAIASGNDFAIKELLTHKADPDLPSSKGEIPLILALTKRNSEAVNLLSRHGCHLELDGADALILAIKQNDVESARILFEKGAKIEAANADGITPLSLAKQEEDGSFELVFTSREPVPTARGSEFFKWYDDYLYRALQNFDGEQDPEEGEQLHRALQRFSSLVSLKLKTVSSELQALPPPSVSQDSISAVEEIIRLWAKKLNDTAQLQARLRAQVSSDGAVAAIRRWEEVIDRRKLFLETLFNRGIDESLAAKATEEKRRELTALEEQLRQLENTARSRASEFGN
jgi:hypothetical protein